MLTPNSTLTYPSPFINPYSFFPPPARQPAEQQKKFFHDRYCYNLNEKQKTLRDDIIYRKEPYKLFPKNYPKNNLKVLEFHIPDLVKSLVGSLKEYITEPPSLFGGAACRVISGINNSDVDICFYVKPAKFEQIRKIIRELICQKIKSEYGNVSDNFIDDNYLYKRHQDKDFFYFSLGGIDLKFILNKDAIRSVSPTDGFHIPLFCDDIAFCVDGSSWCINQEEFNFAAFNLIIRKLIVKNAEKIGDLSLRIAHRMTQAFSVQEIEKLADIAIAQLKKIYPLEQAQKANQLHMKVAAKQLNHYPNSKIGQLIYILNLFAFLKKANENVEHYIKFIGEILFKHCNFPLMELFAAQPNNSKALIDLIRGLFFIEWAKGKPNFEAYSFQFSENPETPRYYISIPDKDDKLFLFLDGSPLEIAKNFLLSLRILEKDFKGNLGKLFEQLPLFFDLKKTLMPKGKIEIINELVSTFEKKPIASINALQFSNSNSELAFYEFLYKEKFEGIPLNFIAQRIMALKLSAEIKKWNDKNNVIYKLILELHGYILKLDCEPNLNNLANIKTLLQNLNENSNLENLSSNKILFNLVKNSLVGIIKHAGKHPKTQKDIIKESQNILTLANNSGLLGNEKFACAEGILAGFRSIETNYDPDFLLSFHDFIGQVERWENKPDSLSKKLAEIKDQIFIHFIETSKKAALDKYTFINQKKAFYCLNNAFESTNEKIKKDLLEASIDFITNATHRQSSHFQNLACSLASTLLNSNIEIPNKDFKKIVQLSESLMAIRKENIDEENTVFFYRARGISLLVDLINKNQMFDYEKQLKEYILLPMANCWISDKYSRKKASERFQHFARFFLNINSIQKKFSKECQILNQLIDEIPENNISSFLNRFLRILAKIDFHLAEQVFLSHQLKTQMIHDDYKKIATELFERRFVKKENEDLHKSFAIWQTISSLGKNDLKDIEFSFDLLKMLIESSPEDNVSKIKSICDFLANKLILFKDLVSEKRNPIEAKLKETLDNIFNLAKEKIIEYDVFIQMLLTANQANLIEITNKISFHKRLLGDKINKGEIVDTILIRFLTDFSKMSLENFEKDKNAIPILELNSNIISHFLEQPKEELLPVLLETFFKMLKLDPKTLWFPQMQLIPLAFLKKYSQKPLSSLSEELIAEFLSNLSNHLASLSDSNRHAFLQHIIQAGWCWNSEKIWKVINNLPINNDQAVFYCEILQELVLSCDASHFKWVKNEIIAKDILKQDNFPLDAKVAGYYLLFLYLQDIAEKSKRTDLKLDCASILARQWVDAFKQINSEKFLKDAQQIHQLLIKTFMSTRQISFFVWACKSILATPCTSTPTIIWNVIKAFSEYPADQSKEYKELKELIFKLIHLILPLHIEKICSLKQDNDLFVIVRAIQNQKTEYCQELAFALLFKVLKFRKQQEIPRKVDDDRIELKDSITFEELYVCSNLIDCKDPAAVPIILNLLVYMNERYLIAALADPAGGRGRRYQLFCKLLFLILDNEFLPENMNYCLNFLSTIIRRQTTLQPAMSYLNKCMIGFARYKNIGSRNLNTIRQMLEHENTKKVLNNIFKKGFDEQMTKEPFIENTLNCFSLLNKDSELEAVCSVKARQFIENEFLNFICKLIQTRLVRDLEKHLKLDEFNKACPLAESLMEYENFMYHQYNFFKSTGFVQVVYNYIKEHAPSLARQWKLLSDKSPRKSACQKFCTIM